MTRNERFHKMRQLNPDELAEFFLLTRKDSHMRQLNPDA